MVDGEMTFFTLSGSLYFNNNIYICIAIQHGWELSLCLVSSVFEDCLCLAVLVPGLLPLPEAWPGHPHLNRLPTSVTDHGAAQPVAHLVGDSAAGLQLSRSDLQ